MSPWLILETLKPFYNLSARSIIWVNFALNKLFLELKTLNKVQLWSFFAAKIWHLFVELYLSNLFNNLIIILTFSN